MCLFYFDASDTKINKIASFSRSGSQSREKDRRTNRRLLYSQRSGCMGLFRRSWEYGDGAGSSHCLQQFPCTLMCVQSTWDLAERQILIHEVWDEGLRFWFSNKPQGDADALGTQALVKSVFRKGEAGDAVGP